MKEIEQTFTHEFGDYKLQITANNNGNHFLYVDRIEPVIFSGGGGGFAKNTKELRKIAKFIEKVADKINADPDF